MEFRRVHFRSEMVHLDGTPAGDVPMRGIGTAARFSGNGSDPETFFAFSDFTKPTTVYRFDTSTGEITIFAQPKIAFDPTAYVTQQLFYPSKDGTPIPMFLIRRADVARSEERRVGKESVSTGSFRWSPDH